MSILKNQSRKIESVSLLALDMWSARGHVNLNNFYLRELAAWKPVLYVSADLQKKYADLTTRSFGKKPCGSGILDQLKTGLRVISILVRQRPHQVVFLSYDLLTFSVISHVAGIVGTKVLCFEHNTAPRTRSQRFLHRIMSSGVKRLVYATHILPFYVGAGIEAIYVPHPCVRVNEAPSNDGDWRGILAEHRQRFKKVAFCPSASVNLELIEQVADEHADTLFVCKNTRSSARENVECHKYFKAYGEALEGCDFVCVLFPFEHKVSGPVFEAIAVGKPVMVLPNAFGKYMKLLFPDKIFYPTEDVPRDSVISVCEYNRQIVKAISQIISRT